MTEGPGLEPWLANGFPPPSFVVETERVAVSGGGVAVGGGGAGPPLRSRLLVGGAILGAILLVAGLILVARGGGDDDQTALDTAPAITTSSIPVVTFPPATVFEPSFLVPQETVPTLPPAAQTPISPITPQPPAPAPAPAPDPAPAPGPAAGTTQQPAPTTRRPGTPTTVQSNPTSMATTPSTATTTPTTTPPSRLSVDPAGPTYRVQDSDPCAVDWRIRAIVSSTSPIDTVKVRSNGASDGAALVKVSGQEVWQVRLPAIRRPAEVTFMVVVTTTDGQQLTSEAETIKCF